MKTYLRFIKVNQFKLLIVLAIIFTFPKNAEPQNLLQAPQKIVIDSIRHRYLVSNFNGGGDLVQIDSLGNQSYFVENAGMTDGLQIVEDTVYGTGPAFTGTVRGYDLNTGQLVMNLDLSGEGVQHLSSFAADSAGFLYTSERFGNRIFKINPKNYTYWVFASGNGIDQPNGILYEKNKNRLLVCLDQNNPPILAISLVDSSVTTVVTTNLEGSDGIAKDLNGNYYITGYYLPGIYKFNPDFSGEPELFYSGNYIVYPTFNEKNNTLLITFYNQNEWGEIPVSLTSVKNKNINPEEIYLYQNYPNPFNPETKIIYRIPQRGFVSLIIYDLIGNEIKTLVSEDKPAGVYEVNFTVKNLQSGIYFCRLKTAHYSKTIKMLLLK